MARSKRSRRGYLLIDNRNAPVPQSVIDAARAAGKTVMGVAGAAKFESDTTTCCHCHRQVLFNPMRTRPRNYCSRCDFYVCDNPGCIQTCNNMNKVLDRAMEHAAKFAGREDNPDSRVILTDAVSV